ncbi:MAGE-domain-containing protein [Lepidopterella palustris CBS 459.81]|uniref:MAGE-domain-containing protein n=1 Tax=Lepidopterella palustris CBS 459.81 TaxID=1314670 RepID=A0A8E2EI58_9PEZI|nr:MAGE-domain-containing protein [Lepidopterella palustris CBS 459.81]
MPLVRKRRAPVEEPDNDNTTLVQSEPSRTQQRSRRQASPESEAEEHTDGDGGAEASSGSTQQLAKKLVRLALACEYARVPIRRADISAKVLGSHSRAFKPVFEEAQVLLKGVFGMEMTELPKAEKVTIQQKRAAQRSENASKSSGAWVLTNVLPARFRDPSILSPPRVPTTEAESAYVGLYTFIVTLISLAGGTLPEAKLDRYLKRTNADQSTPVDKTDKLLARMIKEGYIVKVKDNASGEEMVDYMVGPRGKVEVGDNGVTGLVTSVYGEEGPDDLEKRIERSLGISERRPGTQTNGAASSTQNGTQKGPGRPRRRRPEEEERADEESDDDS